MVLAQVQVDRPPEGLQRGRYAAPRWTIAALGILVVLGALVFFGWRARRAAKARAARELRPPGRR